MKKTISVSEFMKQKSVPERSKLTPFKEDILLLKKNGYTDRLIIEFLEMNGVKVAQSTLNHFIKRNKRNVTIKNNKTAEQSQDVSDSMKTTEPQKNRLSSRLSNRQPQPNGKPVMPNTGFQKFSMREEIDLDDLV